MAKVKVINRWCGKPGHALKDCWCAKKSHLWSGAGKGKDVKEAEDKGGGKERRRQGPGGVLQVRQGRPREEGLSLHQTQGWTLPCVSFRDGGARKGSRRSRLRMCGRALEQRWLERGLRCGRLQRKHNRCGLRSCSVSLAKRSLEKRHHEEDGEDRHESSQPRARAANTLSTEANGPCI